MGTSSSSNGNGYGYGESGSEGCNDGVPKDATVGSWGCCVEEP
jgi:hypothetical protein